MKATDLMIGDWVNYQPGDTPQYMKVGMVSGYDIQLDLYREGGFEVAAQVWFDEENYIQPITLTPEILEKNGWEHSSGSPCSVYQLKAQGGYYISLDSCIKGHFEIQISGLWFEIHSVHELQHALRLCGIEKEVVV